MAPDQQGSSPGYANIHPKYKTILQDTELFRGSADENPFEGQYWFAYSEDVARRYCTNFGRPYLHKYVVRQETKVVDLLDIVTADYMETQIIEYKRIYNEYTSLYATPPLASNFIPAPKYADADGVAPRLQKIFLDLRFNGWSISEGKCWYRDGSDVAFHPEVMLLHPADHLDWVTTDKVTS